MQVKHMFPTSAEPMTEIGWPQIAAPGPGFICSERTAETRGDLALVRTTIILQVRAAIVAQLDGYETHRSMRFGPVSEGHIVVADAAAQGWLVRRSRRRWRPRRCRRAARAR